MKPRLAILILVAVLTLGQSGGAKGQSLITGLSEYLVAITSSFTGSDILVFGAIERISGEEAGPLDVYDVVIIVRGPDEPIIVRRKERIAGIWVNRHSVEFRAVPGFYLAASTRAFREIAPISVLARHQIGLQNLRLAPAQALAVGDPSPLFDYQQALIRNRARERLYRDDEGGVTIIGDTLFRYTVELPTIVPAGNYTVQAFLMKDGRVLSAQTSPLFIDKSGIERRIYRFANEQPLLYGIVAVFLAIAAGWGAAAAFRQS